MLQKQYNMGVFSEQKFKTKNNLDSHFRFCP